MRFNILKGAGLTDLLTSLIVVEAPVLVCTIFWAIWKEIQLARGHKEEAGISKSTCTACETSPGGVEREMERF